MREINIKKCLNSEITESKERFYATSLVKIHFNDYFCVDFNVLVQNLSDLESLAFGYLANLGLDFGLLCGVSVGESEVFLEIDLDKNECVNLTQKREIFPVCESLNLWQSVESTRRILPFNASRASLEVKNLSKIVRDFKSENVEEGENSEIYTARIIDSKITESSDISPKIALYKAFGEAIKNSIESTQPDKTQEIPQNLLEIPQSTFQKPHQKCQKNLKNPQIPNFQDSVLIVNFALNLELLEIILLYKITFCIFTQKPSFTTLQYAQKFGITLIRQFSESEFHIYTHTQRIKS